MSFDWFHFSWFDLSYWLIDWFDLIWFDSIWLMDWWIRFDLSWFDWLNWIRWHNYIPLCLNRKFQNLSWCVAQSMPTSNSETFSSCSVASSVYRTLNGQNRRISWLDYEENRRLNGWKKPLAKVVDLVPLGTLSGPGPPDPPLAQFRIEVKHGILNISLYVCNNMNIGTNAILSASLDKSTGPS